MSKIKRELENYKIQQETISQIDKEFLEEIKGSIFRPLSYEETGTSMTREEFIHYKQEYTRLYFKKLTKLVNNGANVNQKFGKFANDDHDACSYCGPNDTPLTHSVKIQSEDRVEFLLKNGAETEVFFLDETPLMRAAKNHDVKIVDLLLKFDADPNTTNKEGRSAMYYLFSQLTERDLKDPKPCIKIFTLLMEAGFINNYQKTAKSLEWMKKPLFDFFTKTWQDFSGNKTITQGNKISSSKLSLFSQVDGSELGKGNPLTDQQTSLLKGFVGFRA